jgi:hypothetical protein
MRLRSVPLSSLVLPRSLCPRQERDAWTVSSGTSRKLSKRSEIRMEGGVRSSTAAKSATEKNGEGDECA